MTEAQVHKTSNLEILDAKQTPHSSDVEQALLGLLMLNNDSYDNIDGFLDPSHFYVKFHAKIFESIIQLLRKDFEASPITIRENIKASGEEQEDLKEHLANIMDNASQAFNIKDLADIIHSYYLQRQLMDIGSQMSQSARHIPPSEQKEEIQGVIAEAEGSLFKLAENGSNNTVVELKDSLRNVLAQVEESKKHRGKLVGVTSGLIDVNAKTGGFQRSDLIILAARPSMGKTAFAVNIAQNAATALLEGTDAGAAVAIFSMEMSAEQLSLRILSGKAEIDSHKLQNGDLDDAEFGRMVSVANDLHDMKIFIDDTPQLPIATLRSRCRRLKRQHNIGMIVVDYLQLMQGSSSRKNESRVQEISEISQGLKAIARELDVPVIALSQLSRSVESRENKRPMLSDLRESGSIEQDADIVMFLYREDYYLEKTLGHDPSPEQLEHLEKVRGVSELIISKNRKGPTCTVRLTFVPHTTTFKSYTSTDFDDDE